MPTINGTENPDTLAGTNGDDIINGLAGNDTLSGGPGNDELYGGDGNDSLDAGGGNDLLDGGADNDTLTGYFNGYQGDVQAFGGSGNDTIQGAFFSTVDAGDGDDTVHMGGQLHHQVTSIDGGAGNDTFWIAGDSFDSSGSVLLDLTRVVNFETFIIKPQGSAVITDANIGSSGALTVKIEPGYVNQPWYSITVNGSAVTTGSLTLSGGGAGDTLTGGAGNDTLIGNGGNDILTGGAGNDTVYGVNGALETAVFSGNAADYNIQYDVNGATIISGADGTDTLYDVSFLRFSDQTVTVPVAPIIASGDDNNNTLTGGEGNDVLSGAGGTDTLNGMLGNDKLYGEAGNDTLSGGPGNDELYGGDGNDSLDAGGGNDLLDGGADNDTLTGYFNGYQGDVQAFGGSGNDTIQGAFFSTVDAGDGDDTVHMGGQLHHQVTSIDGGAGNDTFWIAGDSFDSSGSVLLDLTRVVNFETFIIKPQGSAVITDANIGSSGALTVKIEPGYVNQPWYSITVNGSAVTTGSLTLSGGGAGDTLTGGAGNDTLIGNGGNDILTGGAGNDTVYGVNGALETAVFSGNAADYNIQYDVNGATIISGADGTDTLYDVSFLRFSDQTVTVPVAPIIASGDDNNNTLTGGEGNDVLSGAGGTDTLNGMLGNDKLYGEAGNDTLSGGPGNDELYGGDGNDSLDAGGGNDLLDGGADNDTLTGYFNGYQGDVQAFGGSGNDTIQGAFFSTVDAGDGDDTVHMGGQLHHQVTSIDGGAGNDTFWIAGDSFDSSGSVLLDLTRVVNFETFIIKPQGSAVITDANIGSSGALTVKIEPGYVNQPWYSITVNGSAVTTGSLTLSGGGAGDTLTGGAGNDTLIGNGGNDILTGGAGNDLVVMTGHFADYAIVNDQSAFTVSDSRIGGDGTDTLDGIDFISFVDGVFNVALGAFNHTPVVANAIADQNSGEEAPWSFQVPGAAFSDADGDTLTYSATLANGDQLPAWLNFTAGTRTFSGTPPLDFNGVLDLKVTARDGSLSATDSFTFTINPVNDAPTVSNLAGEVVTVTENQGGKLLDIGFDAAVVDIDSANFGGGSLTVAVGSALAEDGLFIGTGLPALTSTSSTVSYQGVQFATYSGGGSAGVRWCSASTWMRPRRRSARSCSRSSIITRAPITRALARARSPGRWSTATAPPTVATTRSTSQPRLTWLR